MTGWLWHRGEFVPCDSVPLADRGFRYGMAVFESFPVQNGTPIFLREHLARLRAACDGCGFPIEAGALEKCGELLREDGFARLYVTAGIGSTTGPTDDCAIYLLHEKRPFIPARVYHRGYDLGLAPEPYQPLFNGLKTANYWANLEACRRGMARQKNETLLFNPAAELISASMANVFVLRAGVWHTPALGGGARDGVIREWVLRQRAVREVKLTRADLETADEIFLTSSWLGVMPVASLEERHFKARDAARTLREVYERAVRSS